MREISILIFNVGREVYELRLNLDTDATRVIGEGQQTLMTVNSSASVIFGDSEMYHGYLRPNAVGEWVFQPFQGSPVDSPFSTGCKSIMAAEVELFKTFKLQQQINH
jgi:hypothetical protein